MRDTVFVPSFGNRPKNLVGREDILQIFRDSLQSPLGSRDRAILLLGQRGSGKTVLLLEFAEIARNAGMVVASPTVVEKGMSERILEKISLSSQDFLAKEPPKLTGGTISLLGFGGGLEFAANEQPTRSFAWRLSDICSKVNEHGKSVLILIDEVQANKDELRQLIVAYQEMVGAGQDVYIVFAGLPMTISAVLNDHVLTFLNRARKIQLSPLRKNDIVSYYRDAFSRLLISIADSMILAAAQETAGSPYLMQLIGHYITVGTGDDGNVSPAIFEDAISKAKEDYINDICQTTLNPLSEQDIAFLIAMSKEPSECKVANVVSRLSCTDSHAQTYKRRLIHAGVIEQKRRGEVSFAIPYLRDYLVRIYGDD